MFTTIFVQPIFNLLTLIYALIPGHNFGLAIIIFTIIVRLLMWPLVKKQIYHAKAMQKLAPELKKIKAAAGGDRQKQSRMMMELYKEREINPFATLGILLVQLPIFIGLYLGLTKLINNHQQIIDFSYSFVQNLSWLETLKSNIHLFDNTFFGIVDLGRKAVEPGGLYFPALLIVIISAAAQFYQARQLMPKDKDARSLRRILREAGTSGKSADQSEVNAAVARFTQYLIPGLVFFVGLNFPAALTLYWMMNSIIAIIQQTVILREDVAEAEIIVSSYTEDEKENQKPKTKNQKRRSSKSRKKRKR